MTHNSKRPSLQMPRAEVEKRIRDRIDEGKKLLDFTIQNESDFQTATQTKRKWSDYNGELLKRIVDTEDLVNDYYPSVGFVSWGPTSLRERIVDFRSDITNKVSRLESILERLELIPESPTLQLKLQSSQSTLPTDTNLKQRIQLFQTLCDQFNESELKTLCFHLGVDYESLPDVGKNNKARELIVFLERQARIQDLIEEGKRLNPNSSWDM